MDPWIQTDRSKGGWGVGVRGLGGEGLGLLGGRCGSYRRRV